MSVLRRSRSLRLLLALGFVLAADGLAAAPASEKLHDDNIQAFALVAAVAHAASDRCADIKVNVPMLEGIKTGIGYSPDRDAVAMRAAMQSNLASIADRISALPRPQIWCDSVYAQFGPDGTITQGLMLR